MFCKEKRSRWGAGGPAAGHQAPIDATSCELQRSRTPLPDAAAGRRSRRQGALECSQIVADAKALVRSVKEATASTGVAPRAVLADAGFASEANFVAMEQVGVRAHGSLRREGKPAKSAAPKRMRRRLTARAGRK